jgi:hypothetical protein
MIQFIAHTGVPGTAWSRDERRSDASPAADRAAIVREIFERFADGASCRTIAQEPNDRGVPSPGST